MATATLTWTPGADSGNQLVKYKPYTSSTYTLSSTESPTATTATINGLAYNTLYDFRVTNNCAPGVEGNTDSQGIKFTCPTVNINTSNGQISFTHLGGSITSYMVQLLNEAGTMVIATTTIDFPFSSPITYTFPDMEPGVVYKVRVIPKVSIYSKNDCPLITLSFCSCPTGFVRSSDGQRCEKVETIPATVTHSNYCLATSTNAAYSTNFTRIYNPGFSNSTIGENTATIGSDVYAQLSSFPQWRGNYPTNGNGPMNRAGVWIDSNCDGIKNSLTAGEQTTIAYTYNNTSGPRTVYVGMGGDNRFTLIVNGVTVAQTLSGSDTNFKVWHIFPVNLRAGTNDFNAVAIGDGSVNDAIGMVVYDNTAAEIAAASNDNDLHILFTTATLRGGHIDIATCPPDSGYSLDTSGGVGAYVCRKITTVDCGTDDNTFAATWAWVETDPYVDLQAGNDSLLYQGAGTFILGEDIVTDFHEATDGYYAVVRYPDTETSKTSWNDGLSSGPIPDSAFRNVFSINGYKYIVSNAGLGYSNDPTARITFSTSL